MGARGDSARHRVRIINESSENNELHQARLCVLFDVGVLK